MALLYDFELTRIDGSALNMSDLKGKKVLLVNTASECGYTPQYQQMQELFENTDRSSFVLIGVPSNDFGAQEPGSNAEVMQFCSANFQVSFPLLEKTKVKGEGQHPLFQWIVSQKGEEVRWNFEKFLFNEKGEFVKSLSSDVLPIDEEIVDWIQK